MSVKESLLNFLETIHPGRYRRMSERLWLQLGRLYFFVFCMSLLAFIITGAVVLVTADTSDQFAVLENITLDFDGEVQGEYELVTRPSVVIDTDANSSKGHAVVFSEDKLFYKKRYLVGNDELLYEEIKSFSQISENIQTMAFALGLLLLPGLALLVGVFAFVLTLAFAALASIVGWLVLRKDGMKFRASLMIALHASLVPLFLGVGFLPLFSTMWWAIGLYVVLVVVAYYMQKDYHFKSFQF
jgi:hypothetical protein